MLPSLFISHGSPMHALEPGAAGKAWAGLARSLPRPRAILITSAHWETNVPMLTGNAQAGNDPRLLRLPRAALPAALPGAGLARARPARPRAAWRGRVHRRDRRLPRARSRRVVPAALHVSGRGHPGRAALAPAGARAAAPLSARPGGRAARGRRRPPRRLRPHDAQPARLDARRARRAAPAPYAKQFQSWVHDRIEAGDHEALIEYRSRAPHAARAHPTDEHFLPLFFALGAAGTASRPARVYDAIEGGALAMDAYAFEPGSGYCSILMFAFLTTAAWRFGWLDCTKRRVPTALQSACTPP